MSSLPRCLVGVCVVLFACGGGGGDPPPPDAPPPITGIGQSCVPAMNGADCPAEAQGCLQFAANATVGICTPACLEDATMAVAANGDLTVVPDPLAAGPRSICTSAYTAGIGQAGCTRVVNWSPPDEPLESGKMYTDVVVVCEIGCSADKKCPGTLRCNVDRCEI